MKFLLFALVAMTPAIASAGTAEDAYFKARDGYIQKFDVSGDIDDAMFRAEEEAEADLEAQLKRIVGPVEVAGVSPEATISLDTLFTGDEGFGLLDGLVSASDDDSLRVLVTTEALLDPWLSAHVDWWGPTGAMLPKKVEDALRSDDFYTQAISTDSAIVSHGEIPVVKPAGAEFTFAMLDQRTNGADPGTPDEMIVSSLQGGRLFIVDAPLAATLDPIPECDAIWSESQARADDAYTAYSASDPKDSALFDAYSKIRDEGAAAFRQCFQDRVKDEKAFPAVVAEAQSMLDRLPRP